MAGISLIENHAEPAFMLNERAQHSFTGPPTVDNILVNGTMENANGGGSYFKMTVVKGKKYRIWLINTSVDSFLHVSLVSCLAILRGTLLTCCEGRSFNVITSGLIQIEPYVTDRIAIDINMLGLSRIYSSPKE